MQFDPLVQGMGRLFAGISPQTRLSGWERLRWGMSQQEARINYPQAAPSASDDSRLLIEPSDPTPNHYAISMQFSAQGRQLTSVSLTFAGSHETADFAQITQELTRRLGAPVSQTRTTTTWRRDETQITLSRDSGGGVVLSETA